MALSELDLVVVILKITLPEFIVVLSETVNSALVAVLAETVLTVPMLVFVISETG